MGHPDVLYKNEVRSAGKNLHLLEFKESKSWSLTAHWHYAHKHNRTASQQHLLKVSHSRFLLPY